MVGGFGVVGGDVLLGVINVVLVFVLVEVDGLVCMMCLGDFGFDECEVC